MPLKAAKVIGSTKRFKVLYGGRRSAKTYSFTDYVITRAAKVPTLILCTRELQKSIRDSIHKTLRVRISALGLDDYFRIEKSAIYSNKGSEFIFMGVRHNATEIKGLEGIDVCLIEEAEKMSQDSWDVLEPTISKDDSEILVNFNPELADSPTYVKFVEKDGQPVNHPDCAIAHMTYRDNIFFPDISRKQMEYDREVDPEKYDWIWEGGLKKHHDACIFGSRIVREDFETPVCVRFHYGADWGFSGDPMAINRMFIVDKDLYIDQEFYGFGIDYDDYEAAFDTIPGIRDGRIRADSSSPASISWMKKLGFDIIGAKKGPGSVEDGIRFLKSFRRIVIHTRCTGAWDDFSNYKWKQDPQTKEILNFPVDKSNHVPDNVRYALEPMIRMKRKAVAV